MSNNPQDWSTVASENNNLPLMSKMVNGQKVMLSREESNERYAEWATNHAAAEAAKLSPASYPLNRIQFMAMVEILNKSAEIDAAIGAIADPTARAVAKARYLHSSSYNRDDELLASLAADPNINLTDQEIDDAWMIAKDL